MSPSKRLLNDCFSTDKERMRHLEALAILSERVETVVDTETVALDDAGGRILAEDIIAPRDVPLADNTAVDGYAFSHADYVANNGKFAVSLRVAAGHPSGEALPAGTAARIFTGAVIPEGADTIAMQEDCVIEETGAGAVITIPMGLKPGANLRRAGEDIAEGDVILGPGTRLRPQEMGAIASTGKGAVVVYRRLKVALVSTGDEVVRPGSEIKPGQVYDSNHYLLTELLASLNADVADLGILEDDRAAVEAALSEASAQYDVLITSGGVSKGEEDYLADAVETLGVRHMWQLAIKPGRPVSFGQIGDCVVVGLPGNPVAAFVCFLNYAWPVMTALSGAGFAMPRPYRVPAAFEIPKKKPDRREFMRGILDKDAAGDMVVRKFARDGSGLITSLREADGLIVIEEDITQVAKGDRVQFIPFTDYGIPPRSV